MTERLVYFDCVGGVAGDMLLASLLDLGAPVEAVRDALRALGLDDVQLEVATAHPAGLRALRVDMMVRGELADSAPTWNPLTVSHGHGHGHHRPWRAIRERIEGADLPDRSRRIAQDAFRRLAEAEARVHGVEVETVEFHEVGADDAIADIVGVAVAVDALGIDRAVASPLPLGRGLVQGAHGPIPLPAPATLALLEGAPIVETDLRAESVTPTGAALLRSIVDHFGPLPSMTLEGVGIGTGHRSWPDRPNVVRAVLGRAASRAGERADECVVEANLDDILPAHVPGLIDALLQVGAADAWAEPILMKKGRPAYRVSALVGRQTREAVVQTFFAHSPTLGVRAFDVERELLPRELVRVSTRFGEVRIKLSVRPGGQVRRVPEFEDCRAAAEAHGVSVRDVFDAALVASADLAPAAPPERSGP